MDSAARARTNRAQRLPHGATRRAQPDRAGSGRGRPHGRRRIAANIEQVIEGKHDDRPPRRGRAARRGPPADRGRARRRQDHVRQGAGPLDRLLGAAHPVHARPAAQRRHRRRASTTPSDARLRVQARPGVRQHRRRRRDQPRLAQDPVRAARVHGGAPGHRRRRRPTASSRRSWCSPRRTRSTWRAPTRCPRRSATGSPRGSRWATPTGAPRSRCSTSTPPLDPLDALRPVSDAAEVRALIDGRARGPRRRRGQGLRRRPGRGDPRARPRCGWAPRRARPCSCCARPRPGPRSTGATTSSPTTCSTCSCRCSPTACCSPPTRTSPAARAEDVLHRTIARAGADPGSPPATPSRRPAPLTSGRDQRTGFTTRASCLLAAGGHRAGLRAAARHGRPRARRRAGPRRPAARRRWSCCARGCASPTAGARTARGPPPATPVTVHLTITNRSLLPTAR